VVAGEITRREPGRVQIRQIDGLGILAGMRVLRRMIEWIEGRPTGERERPAGPELFLFVTGQVIQPRGHPALGWRPDGKR